MNYQMEILTLGLRRTAFDALPGGCEPRFHVIGDMDLVVRLAMKWKNGLLPGTIGLLPTAW